MTKTMTMPNGATLDVAKLDPEPILAAIAGKVQPMVKAAEKIRLTTDANAQEAGDMAASMSALIKSVESQRTEFTGPLMQLKRRIDSRFTAITDPLSAALSGLKQKIAQRWAEQQRVAQEKAEAERKRLEKLHEKKVDRAEAAGREAPPPPPMPVANVARTMGGANVREVWDFEVVNMQAVPAHFLEVKRGPILAALAQAAANGVTTEIAGLRTFKRASVAA